jgi:hypothetical protein
MTLGRYPVTSWVMYVLQKKYSSLNFDVSEYKTAISPHFNTNYRMYTSVWTTAIISMLSRKREV